MVATYLQLELRLGLGVGFESGVKDGRKAPQDRVEVIVRLELLKTMPACDIVHTGRGEGVRSNLVVGVRSSLGVGVRLSLGVGVRLSLGVGVWLSLGEDGTHARLASTTLT